MKTKLGMSLSEDLIWRGLIKDKTFEDLKWLDKPQKFYLGFDATADSLTIGNLAVMLLARRFIDAGWQAVLLAGGATSLIGDPGGKKEERQLKSEEEINANIRAISAEIEKLFAGQPREMVNNVDWLKSQTLLSFLRDVGKHFAMTELMQRDFVSTRMGKNGSGISYAEFSYSLLQGYDFWYLFKTKNVVLQIGASDQWGNMISGVPLIRKKEGAEVQAMSMPLVINKSTGVKFGKSEEGTIWLSGTKTTPFQFFQFWYNTPDDNVIEYLKIFTLLSKEEIENLSHSRFEANDKNIRERQSRLAVEVTKIVHGDDQANKQKQIVDVLIGSRAVGSLDNSQIAILEEEIPHTKTQNSGSIVDALLKTKLVKSKTEARRLIESKAVYINHKQAKRDHFTAEDFDIHRYVLIRRGKAYKDSALVELE